MRLSPVPLRNAFYIPKYVGHRGWLGLWLDLPKIDWEEIEGVITEAYRLVAPRTLLAQAGMSETSNEDADPKELEADIESR